MLANMRRRRHIQEAGTQVHLVLVQCQRCQGRREHRLPQFRRGGAQEHEDSYEP